MGRPRKNPEIPKRTAASTPHGPVEDRPHLGVGPSKKPPMVVKPKAEPVKHSGNREDGPAIPPTSIRGTILTTVPCIMCGGPMLVTVADYVSGIDNSKCPFCAVSPAVYLAPEVVNALMKAGINIAVGGPKEEAVEDTMDPDNFGEVPAEESEDPEFEDDVEFADEEEADAPAPTSSPKEPAEEDEDW